MATNTKFEIDMVTSNFIVSSNENTYDFSYGIPRLTGSHHFQSEWDYDNNLLKFQMDKEDAFNHLQEIESVFYKMANTAKSHHFSVMRYERM